MNTLIHKNYDLHEKLMLTCDCLQEEIKKKCLNGSSKKQLLMDLSNVKKERDSLNSEVKSHLKKILHYKTQNVNKRMNTKKKC